MILIHCDGYCEFFAECSRLAYRPKLKLAK